jgi:hypothetical protein
MVERPQLNEQRPSELDSKVPEDGSLAVEQSHHVVAVRTTGIVPESVAERIERELCMQFSAGWLLERIVPVIYNSSTTGYFLLIFGREPSSV